MIGTEADRVSQVLAEQPALAGRTVVATIHQPSSDVFHMFDNLLLLAKGRIMYQDTAAGVVSYFGERGFPCPRYTNPSGTKKLRQKIAKSTLCNEVVWYIQVGADFSEIYYVCAKCVGVCVFCTKRVARNPQTIF